MKRRTPVALRLTAPTTWCALVGCVLAACAATKTPDGKVLPPEAAPDPRSLLPVTHGVSAGDVTATTVTIWARTSEAGTMHVAVGDGGTRRTGAVRVSAARDYTGKVVVDRLTPGTSYRYRVWFTTTGSAGEPPASGASEGAFETAPAPEVPAEVTFAWSGDLGGQNVCRDATLGYPIFRALGQAPLDFFVGLGDMIYADDPCLAVGRFGNAQVAARVGRAATLAGYWEHWKYNREDGGLRAFLATTAYYAVWDDHEVVNDFGPAEATRSEPPYVPGVSVMPLGRQALLDYNPVKEDGERLHRSRRWGKHVELFALDTRQYRDRNRDADSADHPKTMLGSEQRAWVEDAVTHSTATWKVLVTGSPLSIPTGKGTPGAPRDGWAAGGNQTGFVRELTALLRRFRDAGVRNLLFITTDVHFATGFAYRPFPETPEFVVHELVAGPLSAQPFPKPEFDDTLGAERLFLFGSSDPDSIRTYAEASRWFNFGKIRVTPTGKLTASIVDVTGATVAELSLAPR